VALPDDPADTSDRLAIVFFHQPNFDAPIETIPSCRWADGSSSFAPTTSGDHFARKLAAMRGE
jgi:isopenicillin N synthase-like dioxygenase